MEGALQKAYSIRNAINEINRKFQVNEISLFCKPKITSGRNVFCLHLLIGKYINIFFVSNLTKIPIKEERLNFRET